MLEQKRYYSSLRIRLMSNGVSQVKLEWTKELGSIAFVALLTYVTKVLYSILGSLEAVTVGIISNAGFIILVDGLLVLGVIYEHAHTRKKTYS